MRWMSTAIKRITPQFYCIQKDRKTVGETEAEKNGGGKGVMGHVKEKISDVDERFAEVDGASTAK